MTNREEYRSKLRITFKVGYGSSRFTKLLYYYQRQPYDHCHYYHHYYHGHYWHHD